MIRRTLSFASLFILLSVGLFAQEPVDYVQVLMGTDSSHDLSAGNTYPVIARPWGMNAWTPLTGKMSDGWQYTYDAQKIRGFKQTHQPSPWMNDYGQLVLMPTTDKPSPDQDERASWFSHFSEVATPYSYRVYLADYDTRVTMVPTERAARFRINYPEGRTPYLVLDALDGGSAITVDEKAQTITGYSSKNSGGVADNFRCHFVVKTNRPFRLHHVYKEGQEVDSPQAKGDHVSAVLAFEEGATVELVVSSSFVSPRQAELNQREAVSKGIDELEQEGRDLWNSLLGRIRVEGKSVDHMRTFYSTLYRCLLFPRRLYEYDESGRKVHYSPYDGQVHEGYLYGDTGFWDTFRALFPLLNLLYPEEAANMQAGLVSAYRESGFLPEWSSPGHRDIMVGNNSASVVADGYLTGLRGYDVEALWDAVTHGAHAVHPKVSATGRLGWEWYDRLGYVPSDVGINESAARTLEYAYDDWCIWRLGKALGKSDDELRPYVRAATNYRHLYDPTHKLMRGRLKDGTPAPDFNPLKWGGDFTEGNSWHYTWSVFHDPQGLIDLMGGREPFVQMLDSVFSLPPIFDESYYGFVIHEIREMQVMGMGNYAHGNQPIQHMIYLYNYAGKPWKTQYRVREVMDRFYAARPDGYCGDEDNGQTSAWYVFSALGFYPVCPGSLQYVIGSPLFDRVTISLPEGKELSIEAIGNGPSCRYVDAMQIGDKVLDRNYLTMDEIRRGGVLRFQMSNQPNMKRGISLSATPYSFSRDCSVK